MTAGLWLYLYMAVAVVFPDQKTHDEAMLVLEEADIPFETLAVPRFCKGLASPCIIAPGTARVIKEALQLDGIAISGILTHFPFKREIPEADPPDPLWREVLGGLHVTSIGPSFSDPLRLRVEAVPDRNVAHLIPIMARMIRGGAFRPDVPVLAFEEDHRLVFFYGSSLVISRADDLLDFWIMLRSCVDLICSAARLDGALKPETSPRQGIGATEIFKRLPATNCGLCGYASCMEFALCLLTGRCGAERCLPLLEEKYSRHRESLSCLMKAIGFMALDPAAGEVPTVEPPARGTPPCGLE